MSEKAVNYYRNPLKKGTEAYEIKKPDIAFKLTCIGTLIPKTTNEIAGSNWLLGCETLDRDYADYDQYKEYLCPLGIKYLRFQGGWAKTEKVQGVYDWAWLDHIIEDAVARGLKPWLQTGYGNPVYSGAGGVNLGAGMPLSETGRAAYERWVSAMVTRYADRVEDWEVWNEPNFGDNKVNTPEIAADFNIRTARVIRGIQPQARISALALGHMDEAYVKRFFRYLKEQDACGLFHNVTYHDYVYNPDANKLAVYKLRQIVENYAPGLILRQGENGAPSEENAGGALGNYPWSEISQAKWDMRRMLENLGNDIQCSVFSIVEMQYSGNGPITKTNTKGLLKSDARNKVLRPKIAYYAVQHITSVFDDTLERVRETGFRHSIDAGDRYKYHVSTDRSVSVYGYEKKETGRRLYTIWMDDAIPGDSCVLTELDFDFADSQFEQPVLVDCLTGCVYEIPGEQWKKEGNMDRFRRIPVYDSPILLVERSLLFFDKSGFESEEKEEPV